MNSTPLFHLSLKNIAFKRLIGMRTFKTSLATMTALLLSSLPFIANPFYVVMGTIFALQSTVKNSFTVGKQRLIGTALGGVVGFLFVCIPYRSFLLVGLATLCIIFICNQTKNNEAIVLSLTVCLSILISIEDQHPLVYSLFRITDTGIGLVIGIFINYFIAKPNYFKPTLNEIENYKTRLTVGLTRFINGSPLCLAAYKDHLNQIDRISSLYLDDLAASAPQAEDVMKLVEHCHDLRFHLKGLQFLANEGQCLSPEDTRHFETYLNHLSHPTEESPDIPQWHTAGLLDYHLTKTATLLYQLGLLLEKWQTH